MKKFLTDLKLFFFSLFRGMRAADTVILSQEKDAENGGTPEERKVEQNSLYSALLRGEVTQEVKDLRYEMYESVRQSKDWKVVGNGVAVKKNHMLDKTPMKIDDEDGFKVILIQDNKVHMTGAYNAVENIAKLSMVRTESDAEHTFKATHEYQVRYKLETYARKVVVKAADEENKFKLDFYLPAYPVEDDPRAIYAVKELESLYESGSRTSDFTDLITFTFVTDKAYGDDDWKIYDFKVKEYVGIKKFDGNYIISFYASLPNGINDTTKDFNDEESVKKFKNKSPRKKGKEVSMYEVMTTDTEKQEFDEEKAKKVAKKVTKQKKTVK